ncbi:transposase [Paenibacillus sp. MCAF9]
MKWQLFEKLDDTCGQYNLQVPRFRDSKLSTELFKRYQCSEQALVLTMMELVVQGGSTRKVARVTEELCGSFKNSSTCTLMYNAITCESFYVSLVFAFIAPFFYFLQPCSIMFVMYKRITFRI